MAMKLYVGNLAFETTSKDLEALFTQAGMCDSATVVTDRSSGQSRGFGFVEMSSKGDGQQAIQKFNGHELHGRALRVNEAREDRAKGFGSRRY